jgi:hypothetical protein
MLVTFQSRAAPDVVMLRDLAQYLLGLVGRRLDARGAIIHDDLADAIRRLEAALAAAERHELAHEGLHYSHDHQPTPANELSQRAWPFLSMMREAEKQHADVIWGL